MSAPRPASLAAVLALAVALLGGGCKGKSPTATQNGGSTAPSFDFSFPVGSASHAYTFAQEGTWNYFCKPHQTRGMVGTIFVRASSLNTARTVAVAPGGLLKFEPDTVTIAVNGTITWTASSTTVSHTATR